MGYTKLFSSILDSTIWQTPIHVKVVWITMLAMADQDGEVQASVPGLAIRAGVERAQCEQALAILSAPDPDSRTPTAEGRRIEKVDGGWRLINHDVYRHKMSVEERREKEAERKRRYRERMSRMSRGVPPCPEVSHDVTSVPVGPASSLEVPTSEADQKQKQKQTESLSARDATKVPEAAHLAEAAREAVRAAMTKRGAAAPRDCDQPMAPVWEAVALHVVKTARVTGEDPKHVLKLTVRGFADHEGMRAKGWPMSYLAKNPQEFLTAGRHAA